MSRKFSFVWTSCVLALVMGGIPARGDETCKDSAGNKPCVGTNSPCVCLYREGDAPLENVDFTWDFSDPSKPDVTLLTGSSSWAVWSQQSSQSSTPADLGDLKLGPGPQSSEDFEVTIAHGTTAGADDVISIQLTDTDWTGYSSLKAGSKIAGNVTGNITVVQDSGNNGGTLNLEIQDGLSGDIDAYSITSLEIDGPSGTALSGDITADVVATDGSIVLNGNVASTAQIVMGAMGKDTLLDVNGALTGDIDIDGMDQGAHLDVSGLVAYQSTISIENMTGTTGDDRVFIDLNSSGPGTAQFNGDLSFPDGIPYGTRVRVYGLERIAVRRGRSLRTSMGMSGRCAGGGGFRCVGDAPYGLTET